MSAAVAPAANTRQLALTSLVLGPVLLILGLAIGMSTDAVGRIIPLERAWIGGVLALPMLVLAPAMLSLAWSDSSLEWAARWISRGIAVAIGLSAVALLGLTRTYLGCQPVTDPIQTLPYGAILGVVAGAGFFGAVAAGRWFASSERPVAALAAGAIGSSLALVLLLIVYSMLFPGVSCAPVLPAA